MKCTVTIDIYECKVFLEIVPTTKDVCSRINTIAKKLKIEKPNEPNDCAWGQVINNHESYYIILSQQSLKDMNTFLHELSHCVDSILEDRDIIDCEARAYLQGYIGDKLIKKIL